MPLVTVLPTGSVEPHAGEERNRTAFLLNEPLEGFLEDALAIVTKLSQESVESALGGGALVATIEEGHEVIADLSDLVTVQTNHSHAFVVADGGVCKAEVSAGVDGLVHFDFDGAHLRFLYLVFQQHI